MVMNRQCGRNENNESDSPYSYAPYAFENYFGNNTFLTKITHSPLDTYIHTMLDYKWREVYHDYLLFL